MVEDRESAGPLETMHDEGALLPGHVHRGQHPEQVMVGHVGELEALPAPEVQTASRRVNVATGERAGGAAPVKKQTIARVHVPVPKMAKGLATDGYSKALLSAALAWGISPTDALHFGKSFWGFIPVPKLFGREDSQKRQPAASRL